MATAPVNSTPLPTPPSTTDPGNFDARADAFLGALPAFQSQTDSQATTTYNNALAAEEAAGVAKLAGDRATDKATEALTSANNANTAKLAAEAALDSFDDRYLGAKSSDPVTDNDGNPLIVGALYFRTTAPVGMKVLTASGWDDAYANLSSKYDKTGGDITGQVGVVGSLTLKSPSAGVAGKLAFQETSGGAANFQIGKNDFVNNWADISHTAPDGMLNISQSGAGTINTLINNTVVQKVTTAGVRVISGGIGYGVGAGDAVTQLTSKSTGVTLNKSSGRVITHYAELAAGDIVSFTLLNNQIAGDDVLAISVTGGPNPDAYLIRARIFSGGAVVSIVNQSGRALSDAIQFQFVVLKGAVS